MVQTDTAQALVITRRATDTAATTAQLIARRASIAAAVVEQVRDRAQAAQTSQTMHRTQARAQSTRATAAGNATQDTTIKMASVSAAPTNPVGRTSSVRVRATTRVAMATNATAVLQTARQASISAAVELRVEAFVRAAPMHPKMRHIPVRDLST